MFDEPTETPLPNLEAQAAIELRGMDSQGNYKPRLDSADVAVSRVVARHLQRMERRIRWLEDRLRKDG